MGTALGKGILQGTSYSAELFFRIIAWAFDFVIENLDEARPKILQRAFFLPLLLYADDILLLGRDSANLQH